MQRLMGLILDLLSQSQGAGNFNKFILAHLRYLRSGWDGFLIYSSDQWISTLGMHYNRPWAFKNTGAWTPLLEEAALLRVWTGGAFWFVFQMHGARPLQGHVSLHGNMASAHSVLAKPGWPWEPSPGWCCSRNSMGFVKAIWPGSCFCVLLRINIALPVLVWRPSWWLNSV